MSKKRNVTDLDRAISLEKEGAGKAAVDAYLQACKSQPQERESWIGLARTNAAFGKFGRACWALEQWLKQQDQDAEAWEHLGRLYTFLPSFELAVSCLRRALKIDPRRHHAKQSLLFALKQQGLTDDLEKAAGSILKDQPNHLASLIARALSLPPVYKDRDDLWRWRRRYLDELDRLAKLDPVELAGQNNIAELEWTNFYLAYQGEDDLAAQTSYSRFLQGILGASSISQLAGDHQRSQPGAEPRRIRVGFLSSFFRTSSVGKYFSSWVTDLPRDRFDVHLYFTGKHADALTKKLAMNCTCFHHLRGGLEVKAKKVLADQLDILVYPEVGMEGEVQLLANLRLAPIQIAGWGHPVTTGSSVIDYFLSSAEMEPQDASAHYSETLITLPGLGTRYACPETTESASRTSLRLPVDKNIYLVPQSLFKIHPDNDEIYMQILQRDENAVLVFFTSPVRAVMNAFTRRLQGALDKHRIEARSQIKFLPRLSWDQFLEVNAVADVMLDSLHWSGGQTSIDALASNLPVVTLPGRFMRGRQTLGMLNIIGLPELIADSTESYIDKAIEVATNKDYNAQLKQRIAKGKSKLFDQRQPTTALASVLEDLYLQKKG